MTTPELRAPYFDGVTSVLLDFDGPVTALMPAPVNRQVADAARAALSSRDLLPPEPIAQTSDHLAVLRWTGLNAPEAVADVEEACVASEVDAARSTPETAGVRDLLVACDRARLPVVIVSNNARDAIEVFLETHGLAPLVRDILGRPLNHPELMKPDTHLVRAALAVVGAAPATAVLIGDSVSDVVVAQAAGVRTIGFAKHARRGRELTDEGADFVVSSIAELTGPAVS